MNPNRSKRTDPEITTDFDNLFDLTPEPETDEEIREFLQESGYDVEALKVRGREFVNELIANNWRFASAEKVDEVVARIDQVPLRKNWSREQLTAAIQKVMAAFVVGGTPPAWAYRNQEQLTNSDLATLLQELEFTARENGIEFDLNQG
jgi:arsenate reductase-like glutaredoxin family protein